MHVSIANGLLVGSLHLVHLGLIGLVPKAVVAAGVSLPIRWGEFGDGGYEAQRKREGDTMTVSVRRVVGRERSRSVVRLAKVNGQPCVMVMQYQPKNNEDGLYPLYHLIRKVWNFQWEHVEGPLRCLGVSDSHAFGLRTRFLFRHARDYHNKKNLGPPLSDRIVSTPGDVLWTILANGDFYHTAVMLAGDGLWPGRVLKIVATEVERPLVTWVYWLRP